MFCFAFHILRDSCFFLKHGLWWNISIRCQEVFEWSNEDENPDKHPTGQMLYQLNGTNNFNISAHIPFITILDFYFSQSAPFLKAFIPFPSHLKLEKLHAVFVVHLFFLFCTNHLVIWINGYI